MLAPVPRGHGEGQPPLGRTRARARAGEEQHRLAAGVTRRGAGPGPALLCAVLSEHLPFPGIFRLLFSLSPEPVPSLAIINHFGWGRELYLNFCP